MLNCELGLTIGRLVASITTQVWPISEARIFNTEPGMCGACVHRAGAGGPNVVIGEGGVAGFSKGEAELDTGKDGA